MDLANATGRWRKDCNESTLELSFYLEILHQGQDNQKHVAIEDHYYQSTLRTKPTQPKSELHQTGKFLQFNAHIALECITNIPLD